MFRGNISAYYSKHMWDGQVAERFLGVFQYKDWRFHTVSVEIFLVHKETDLKTLRLRHNRWHFAVDIFKYIFLMIRLVFNDKVRFSIQISLKCFSKGPNHQFISNGLDNGLVLKRWQAIICTNTCVTRLCVLTHLPLVPHICIGELSKHWFR